MHRHFQKAEMGYLNETKHISMLCLIHCSGPYPVKSTEPASILDIYGHDKINFLRINLFKFRLIRMSKASASHN